jgi:hypothetical protein
MAKRPEGGSMGFLIRVLPRNIFVGIASERYGGWMGRFIQRDALRRKKWRGPSTTIFAVVYDSFCEADFGPKNEDLRQENAVFEDISI